MVGLLDIHPQSEQVKIGNRHVDVVGISAKGIAALLSRFPNALKVMSGQTVSADDLKSAAPDALAAVIAAATGNLGNAEAETRAENLPLEVQLDIVQATGRLTFPSGFGPFVERLTEMSNAFSEQVTKASAMRSPPPSKPSAEPPSPPSGTSPPDK